MGRLGPRQPFACVWTSNHQNDMRIRDVLWGFVQKGNTASCGKEISLLDDGILLQSGALTPSRVSDLYLMALAAANDARFATFDTRIPAAAVAGGAAALEIIPVA